MWAHRVSGPYRLTSADPSFVTHAPSSMPLVSVASRRRRFDVYEDTKSAINPHRATFITLRQLFGDFRTIGRISNSQGGALGSPLFRAVTSNVFQISKVFQISRSLGDNR
jgi:hypothetical protein